MEKYLETMGTPGLAIFAVLGLLVTAFVMGRFLLGYLWRGVPDSADRQFFVALTLGINVLILTAMPLLWLGVLPDLAAQIVFTAGLLAGAWLLVKNRQYVLGLLSPIPWHLAPFALLGLILLKNALSYPFSFDDLVYQIAVPDRWRKTNSLAVFLDVPFSAFPGVNLIGNLLLLKAGGVLGPLLLNYALGLIVALAVHFLIRRHAGPWPATMLSLSLVLSVSYLMVFMSAYAEPWILLQLTGILFLLQQHGPNIHSKPAGEVLRTRGVGQPAAPATQQHLLLVKREWLGKKMEWLGKKIKRPAVPTTEPHLLLGLFAGFAASVKLTGIIVPVAVAGYLIVNAVFVRRRAWAVRFLQFAGPALLVIVLFYARSYAATGNPLYPYFCEYFTTDEATVAMTIYHHDAGKARFGTRVDSPGQAALFYVETPLLLILGPVMSQSQGPMSVYDGYFGLQGLVPVLLIGLVLRAWYLGRDAGPDASARRATVVVSLGFGWLFYTFWFFTAQQSRFLLPGYLCLVLAGSCGWHLLSRRQGQLLMLVPLVLALLSLRGPIVDHLMLSLQATNRNNTPINFLHSSIGDDYLTACDGIRQFTPPDAKIMLLYEQRGLYVPRPHVVATPYFQARFFTPPDKIVADEDLLGPMRDAGITHVLVAYTIKDPDRMQKYMDLGKPLQARLKRLIELGQSDKAEDAARGQLRLVQPWPPELGLRLYEVDYGK